MEINPAGDTGIMRRRVATTGFRMHVYRYMTGGSRSNGTLIGILCRWCLIPKVQVHQPSSLQLPGLYLREGVIYVTQSYHTEVPV
jgi:hypothetical protein